MLGYYDYTVILTYLSAGSSFVGMCFAVRQEFTWAIVCLLLSGLCDMFDGMVARTKKNRTEAEKKNGIQLDSLADVVCFGAFPAIMGYCLGMHTKYHWLFAVVGAFFVLCAIIRLAYFNVTEEIRQQETEEKRKSYEGLPVTSVALLIPAVFCTKNFFAERFPYVYAIALLVFGACFITNFKIKKFGMIGNLVMAGIGLVLFGILIALKYM